MRTRKTPKPSLCSVINCDTPLLCHAARRRGFCLKHMPPEGATLKNGFSWCRNCNRIQTRWTYCHKCRAGRVQPLSFLAARADEGIGKAQQQISKLACKAGISQGLINAAKDWATVVKMIHGTRKVLTKRSHKRRIVSVNPAQAIALNAAHEARRERRAKILKDLDQSLTATEYQQHLNNGRLSLDEVKALEMAVHSTGAKRGTDLAKLAFTLMSPIAIRRYASVMSEGAKKYDEYNWEKGFPIRDLLEHLINHVFMYLDGDRSEDHLGHALWNMAAAVHSEEAWPELNNNLRPVKTTKS